MSVRVPEVSSSRLGIGPTPSSCRGCLDDDLTRGQIVVVDLHGVGSGQGRAVDSINVEATPLSVGTVKLTVGSILHDPSQSVQRVVW